MFSPNAEILVAGVIGPVLHHRHRRPVQWVRHRRAEADDRAQSRHVGRLQLGRVRELRTDGQGRQAVRGPLLIDEGQDLLLDGAERPVRVGLPWTTVSLGFGADRGMVVAGVDRVVAGPGR